MGTGDDEGSALVGDDYQAELRRIAEQAASKGAAPRVAASAENDDDDEAINGYDYSVTTPSGATLPVLTDAEVQYYQDRADRYQTDHKFSSVTDLQDLDRVLSTELMLHRYDVWLTLGNDYWGNAVSEKDLLRYNKELSATLTALKKSMSLDKATRDKDQGADFVGWLEDVKRRAKEFGIMREEQLSVGLTLFHEVKGKLVTYRNCDDVEREELGLSAESIIQWLWDDVFPRFDKVDQHFLNNEQRFWRED